MTHITVGSLAVPAPTGLAAQRAADIVGDLLAGRVGTRAGLADGMSMTATSRGGVLHVGNHVTGIADIDLTHDDLADFVDSLKARA